MDKFKKYKRLNKVQMTVDQEEITVPSNNIQTNPHTKPEVINKNHLYSMINMFNKQKTTDETNKNMTVFLPSHVNKNAIPINKIVYCSVIPSHQNSILLVWKHQNALLCRVYVFSSIFKSLQFKNELAMRFERNYRAWQFQFCRQSITKYSIKPGKNQVHFCTPTMCKKQLNKQSSNPY